ncbi:fumarylacetoacetase [Pseudovibrio exalbescens]|uniref:fumarylacetoacetase n=1 Tax=Pseudovibrio exalbescens TaxID=197461 RepID=A0A1U7JHV2_9HYPH|nr:fumarylacetoacetase [Pseudovibrio exalbescens]OKL44309.1 fumarylacetoacetase [Pseudovibrio exalbescens]
MKSWVESANQSDSHFPIQNLPYGVFSVDGHAPRCGVALGEFVIDLSELEEAGLVSAGGSEHVFNQPALNEFMALGKPAWDQVRDRLVALFKADGDPALKENAALRDKAMVLQSRATMHLPFHVAEYTDFYAGRQHAFNVGTMFRGPENALPPNWLHIPIGYNGRASTVVVSGTDIARPLGQKKAPTDEMPRFGACERLDIELEMGAVVGLPSEMGRPISVQEADGMIFGYVLLNDWSARDIQAWEYQPLGPFQAKAFATSISPWVVTKAALEPFRTSTPPREKELLPYLREPGPMLYNIELEVLMQPEGADKPTRIAKTNYNNMYYSAAQQLAHHAVSGCKMSTGDLLGSGTVSGPEKTEYGSLLELTWGGKEPLELETGETRRFIEDGDTLTLTGWAQGDGYRIGFGECVGTIKPSPDFDPR